jgi:deoxycytidylate deaminase
MKTIPPPCAVNNRYFKLARQESLKSSYRIKIGAVLKTKKATYKGHNKLKTHPRFANPEIHIKLSIHAEIDCIMKAKYGEEIYVYREDRNGNPALSRPCENCRKELKNAGIEKIFYSIPNYPFWKMEYL